MKNKDAMVFINHIMENIIAIKEFSKNVSKKSLFADKQKQYAIVRAIEIIGESAKNLPEHLKRKYPKILWREIIGTRDKLIHHYFGVDLEEIWKIIKEDIPDLEGQVKNILERER
jgi:uncharacterized protein with HEPN domain